MSKNTLFGVLLPLKTDRNFDPYLFGKLFKAHGNANERIHCFDGCLPWCVRQK